MVYNIGKKTGREEKDVKDGYSVLARVYDRLNDTVDYGAWADFIEEIFARYAITKPSLVLDLGCGTGSMTLELCRRGYDMTALDLSEDMLTVADERLREAGCENVLILRGDMTAFELYGTVDAVVCCLDGINHITKTDELYSCFSCVANYLSSDGLFVFDLNTPYRFSTEYADRDYVLEDDGAMCVWRNRLNSRGNTVDFYLTVYEENEDGTWTRADGEERERAYSLRYIKKALGECGLELLNVSSDYNFTEPDDKCVRWYITARKK